MNKGFSLVELIVVIAIMAILVGVAVPVYTSYIDKANDATDIQAIDNLEHACKIVAAEYTAAITFGEKTESNKYYVTATLEDEEAAAQLDKILGVTTSAVDGKYVYSVEVKTLPNSDAKDKIELPKNITNGASTSDADANPPV